MAPCTLTEMAITIVIIIIVQIITIKLYNNLRTLALEYIRHI